MDPLATSRTSALDTLHVEPLPANMSPGCRGKPAGQNRMNNTSFSQFAARLREFIRISSGQRASPSTFGQLAMELFELQVRHNVAYRRICQARGFKPTHWEEVPPIPTSAFKEFDITCLAPEDRTAVFHSSGTTEQRPSRHFHSAESLRIYEESVSAAIPDFLRAGGNNGKHKQLLILSPNLDQAPHSSLVRMFHVYRREFGPAHSQFAGSVAEDGAWSMDLPECLAVFREVIAENRALLMLGTAFSYVHLLDYLDSTRLFFQLPPGSLALETGGYKGRSRSLPKSELHELLDQRLGIPRQRIFCEYGMSELSSQAYDSPATDSRLFRFPPWARALVVSPETGREVAEGETGLLRVFDLANVFSAMAVQTEDLAVRHPDGFELIGRAQLTEPRGCSLMPA